MPSFIIVGYVWQISGREWAFLPSTAPPIREQPRKNPSWIGLIFIKCHKYLIDFLLITIHNSLHAIGRNCVSYEFDYVKSGTWKVTLLANLHGCLAVKNIISGIKQNIVLKVPNKKIPINTKLMGISQQYQPLQIFKIQWTAEEILGGRHSAT